MSDYKMFTKVPVIPNASCAVGGMVIQGHGKSLAGNKLTCCHGNMTRR